MTPVKVGWVTLYLGAVMSMVLANHPDRVCQDCDGYIALEDCAEIGNVYVLELGDDWYTVKVADCLNSDDREAHYARWGHTWLADADETIWDDRPWIPQEGRLWEVATWEMRRVKRGY